MRTGNRAFRCSSGHPNAKAPVLPGLRRKWGYGSLSQSRARRYNTPARAASSVCPVCRGLLPTRSGRSAGVHERPDSRVELTPETGLRNLHRGLPSRTVSPSHGVFVLPSWLPPCHGASRLTPWADAQVCRALRGSVPPDGVGRVRPSSRLPRDPP